MGPGPSLGEDQVSLQLGKLFSSDNGVSVSIMYLYVYGVLQQHTALSLNMYWYFMNTKYQCACYIMQI